MNKMTILLWSVCFLFVLFVDLYFWVDLRVKKQAEIFALSSLLLDLRIFLIIVLGVKLRLYIFGLIWEHAVGESCSGASDAVHATPLAGRLYFSLSSFSSPVTATFTNSPSEVDYSYFPLFLISIPHLTLYPSPLFDLGHLWMSAQQYQLDCTSDIT